MRIVITDTALIWYPNHPMIKQLKNVLLLVCLNGKQITEDYECFISPYRLKDTDTDEYGPTSPKYQALESVAMDLNKKMGYNDDILFLTDGNPESLYPYYLIKSRNKYNSLHLCTISPWNFDESKKITAHKKMLSDLSGLKSILYIDSDRYIASADKHMSINNITKTVRDEYLALLPRIINGIDEMGDISYFDMASKSYIPVEEGFDAIDLSKALEKITELNRQPYKMFSTLGMCITPDYPEEDYCTKELLALPVARIDGKKTCNLLRNFRFKLAELNQIEFFSEECPSIGPCAGTCAKCDQESSYLRKKLNEIPKNKQKIPKFDMSEWEV